VGADTSGGALRNLSGNNIVTGAITLAAATTVQSDAGTLNINGGMTGAFPLTVEGAGNTTINGIVGTAAGTIIKNDAGTLTLNNANTYTGATTINAGTVTVTNATGLGTTAGATTVTATGAALNINGVSVAENLTLNGTGVATTGALTGTGVSAVTGTVALATNSSIGAASVTDILTLGGVVSGTGTNLTKVGAGTVILSAANTYNGTTTISAGTLQVGAGSTTGTISTTGNITNNGVLAINRSDAYAVNAAQTITGTGSVQQIGAGTTTLTAAGNDYTGATLVSNGELRARVNGTSSVTVGELGGTLGSNAATLAVTGTVTGGVTVGGVGNVGVLALGATTAAADNGLLTINGTGTALTVASGSQLQLGVTNATLTSTGFQTYWSGGSSVNALDYLNGIGSGDVALWNVAPASPTDHDRINLTGAGSNLSIGTRSAPAFGSGSVLVSGTVASPTIGMVFNLIDWMALTTMSGTFTNGGGTGIVAGGTSAGDLDLPSLSAGFGWDTSAFQSYGVLVIVPEPSRLMLLFFGLFGLFFRRRRND
jgi:autotransporter-associated beta strand protein